MIVAVIIGMILGALASPWFLPPVLMFIRFRLFRALNGEEGIEFPNEEVKGNDFKYLYGHKDAHGRSKQNTVGLSDLFWYLLSPGPHIHQEHIESHTSLYSTASLMTKLIVNVPKEELEDVCAKYVGQALGETFSNASYRIIRLRDYFMPIFTRIYYELVFGEPCSDAECKIIVGSADNVVSSIKFTQLRSMRRRLRATKLLMSTIERHLTKGTKKICEVYGDDIKDKLSDKSSFYKMSLEEKALHLQGVIFHTGVVQMSEAMAHLLLCLGQHPNVQKKLLGENIEGQYFDMVIAESLRLFPLFGIAHRIATSDISLPTGKVIQKGSVMCFNYPKYHSMGYERPSEFIPERWSSLSKHKENYIPFGIPSNRPCPGQRIALIFMKSISKFMVPQVNIFSSITHSRSLPCRGLCIIAKRPKEPNGLSASAEPSRMVDVNGAKSRDSSCESTDDESEDINSIVKYTLEQQQQGVEDIVLEESQIDMDGGKVMMGGRKGRNTLVNIAPLMAFMRFKDRYETAVRSIKQIVLGYIIITDARKLQLAYSMTHSSKA